VSTKLEAIQRRRIIMLIVAASLSLIACEPRLESTFELAAESRLPKWFTLPPGLSRLDVTVTMNYYVTQSGRTAKFILRDAKKKLAEVNGVLKGLEPLKLKNSRSGIPLSDSAYEVITVNGMTEIIEHRQMVPTFYITDDPVVSAELGVHN
jgi:hypothetical protein